MEPNKQNPNRHPSAEVSNSSGRLIVERHPYQQQSSSHSPPEEQFVPRLFLPGADFRIRHNIRSHCVSNSKPTIWLPHNITIQDKGGIRKRHLKIVRDTTTSQNTRRFTAGSSLHTSAIVQPLPPEDSIYKNAQPLPALIAPARANNNSLPLSQQTPQHDNALSGFPERTPTNCQQIQQHPKIISAPVPEFSASAPQPLRARDLQETPTDPFSSLSSITIIWNRNGTIAGTFSSSSPSKSSSLASGPYSTWSVVNYAAPSSISSPSPQQKECKPQPVPKLQEAGLINCTQPEPISQKGAQAQLDTTHGENTDTLTSPFSNQLHAKTQPVVLNQTAQIEVDELAVGVQCSDQPEPGANPQKMSKIMLPDQCGDIKETPQENSEFDNDGMQINYRSRSDTRSD